MSDEYNRSIVNEIFINPASECDTLTIVTHKATPSMASWLLKTYEEKGISDLSIELIISFPKRDSEDMFEPIILQNNHEGFKELHKRFQDSQNVFSCSYYCGREYCSDNLYIWKRRGTVFLCFKTNCEFTQQNILNNKAAFVKVEDIDAVDNICSMVSGESIYCVHPEAEDYVIIRQKEEKGISEECYNQNNFVTLPLITKKTGEPGQRSGLNWGQRMGRNPNEAYIPLPKDIAQSGFFPLHRQHFLVITDDHVTLLLRVEQQGDKAITTPASNALLGEYFRNRLNLKYGAYVSRADLDAYGRLDVTFYKIDEEQYYMDFSSPRKKNKDGR